MASMVTQSRGLDGIPASVKVTLRQIILRMMASYELTEKEIKEEKETRAIRAEIVEQHSKLLDKFNRKEIAAQVFNVQDLQYNLSKIDYDSKLEMICKRIDTKQFRQKRLKLVQEILSVDINQSLSLNEKYALKDKLYSELCQTIKLDAITSLSHDINLERLKIHRIDAIAPKDKTEEQINEKDKLHEYIKALRYEVDTSKKLTESDLDGAIRQISFDLLVSDDATKLTHKIFAEELYENADKKRAM